MAQGRAQAPVALALEALWSHRAGRGVSPRPRTGRKREVEPRGGWWEQIASGLERAVSSGGGHKLTTAETV